MIKNNKKGVELTLNTVIIAALVVLVLLIVAFILIRGFSSSTGAMSCQAQGGECSDKCPPSGKSDYIYVKPWPCNGTRSLCCSSKFLD